MFATCQNRNDPPESLWYLKFFENSSVGPRSICVFTAFGDTTGPKLGGKIPKKWAKSLPPKNIDTFFRLGIWCRFRFCYQSWPNLLIWLRSGCLPHAQIVMSPENQYHTLIHSFPAKLLRAPDWNLEYWAVRTDDELLLSIPMYPEMWGWDCATLGNTQKYIHF